MTAIIVIRQPDAVYIATDGAVCEAGLFVGLQAKAIVAPHLPAIFTFRGYSYLFAAVHEHLGGGEHATFDDMLANAVASMRTAYEEAANWPAYRASHCFDLVIAGWSAKRARAEAYLLSNSESDGTPAWTLRELGTIAMAPPLDDAIAERFRLRDPRALLNELHPAQAALRLMEAQRHVTGSVDDESAEYHSVGGFCQLTVLDRDAIATRILKRWPAPAIGEPLDPMSAAA